jgi:hypothetical protein
MRVYMVSANGNADVVHYSATGLAEKAENREMMLRAFEFIDDCQVGTSEHLASRLRFIYFIRLRTTHHIFKSHIANCVRVLGHSVHVDRDILYRIVQRRV